MNRTIPNPSLLQNYLVGKTLVKIDESDNKLILCRNEYSLILKAENGRVRNLGKVQTHKGVKWFITERDFKKHRHEKSNSWGFNHCLLEELKDSEIKFLSVKTNSQFYWIELREALASCTYLNHKVIGFELQCLVGLGLFTIKNLKEEK